jgi:predicted XRE-type DNA-binding protein
MLKSKSGTKKELFRELGFSEEESHALKRRTECIVEIIRIVRVHDYTQKDLSKIFDIPQSRVSDLLNAKVSKFSTDLLLDYLELLGAEPQIRTKVKSPKRIIPRVSLTQHRSR